MALSRIGILTGGGDCPGLNAVIRACVRRAQNAAVEVLGVRNGWQGLIDGNAEPLTSLSVAGILPKGGTILGTSRTDPLREPRDLERLRGHWLRFGLDGLVVVGGDGTLAAARDVARHGLPLVAVPKTIDEYLAPLAADHRAALEKLRRDIRAAAPPLTRSARAMQPRRLVRASVEAFNRADADALAGGNGERTSNPRIGSCT